MLAFTIAHLSICVLRYREPDRPRPYRMPGGRPRAAAACCRSRPRSARCSRAPRWITVIVLHAGRALRRARLAGGRASRLYVVYRKREGKPLGARVTVPEHGAARDARRARLRLDPRAAARRRARRGPRPDRGAACQRRAATRRRSTRRRSRRCGSSACRCRCRSTPAARGPARGRARRARARQARRRGVHRRRGRDRDGARAADRRGDRRGGPPARRRGDRPRRREGARTRAGSLLGGRTLVGESSVSETVRYVVERAPCRVILTAPVQRAAAAARRPPPTSSIRRRCSC